MSHPISLQTWRQLIDLALQFRAEAPWQWMCEGDVFGIEHPDTGETGYCVVRGAGEPDPGLTLYLGCAGRHSYHQSFYLDTGGMETGALQIRNCLSLSFSAYPALSLPDRRLHRSMKLDRKELSPVFRDHADGWLPWPLQDRHQAFFLIHALEQSMDLARRLQRDADLLTPPELGKDWMLVRVSGPAKGPWQDEWRNEAAPYCREGAAEANLLFLRSHCGRLPLLKDKTWWIKVSSQKHTRGKPPERPFYPQLLRIRDSREQPYLMKKEFSPHSLHRELQVHFKNLLLSAGYRPALLCAENTETYQLMGKIAASLDIPLQHTGEKLISGRRMGYKRLPHGR